jgi:hypothetical protein
MGCRTRALIRKHRHIRRCTGSGAIAEFAPVLFIFFLVILFPLINLIGFATSSATVLMITRQSASIAGASTTWQDAVAGMEQETTKWKNSGFGKFANITPVGGANGCGADLYIAQTNLSSGNTTYGSKNSGLGAPADTQNNIFEYQIRTQFRINPWLNMSGMPFIGSVPIVGQPANCAYIANSNVEHPEGLQ